MRPSRVVAGWIAGVVFLVLAPAALAADAPVLEWSRAVSRGWARPASVSANLAGDVVVSGDTERGSTGVAFVRRFDPSGRLVWGRSFGRAGRYTTSAGVAIDGGGGAYVVLSMDIEPDPGSTDASLDRWALVRVSADGAVRWRRTGGAGCPADTYATAVDAARDVVAIAVMCRGDQRIRAYDARGRFLWENGFEASTIRAAAGEYVDHVAVTETGSVVVAGTFEYGLPRVRTDVVIQRLSPRGHVRWSRRLGDLRWVGGIDIRGGRLIAVGSYDRGVEGWTARIAPSTGRIVWERRWPALPTAVSISPSGYVWALDENDASLVGFTPRGVPAWIRTLRGYGVDVTTCADGGYVAGVVERGRLWRYRA
jgi:outer membrane protein assembly factor BamB